MMHVYLIGSTVSPREYVGISKTPDKRWRAHLNQVGLVRRPLYEDMEALGPLNFTLRVIASHETERGARQHEAELIRELKAAGKDPYNSTTRKKYRKMSAPKTPEERPLTGIQEACDKVGSQEALADLLGVTKQAVQKFVAKGYVPLRRALEIEAQTGVDRKRLVDPSIVDLLT